MSGVEMQSYAPVGGRDSRSPSLDDLSLPQHIIGDPSIQDELAAPDSITIHSGAHGYSGRRGSDGMEISGSMINNMMIQPFNNRSNPHGLNPNSDLAHGIVADHERNQCRCCCGILLSLPNLVLTIMVIFYSMATWGTIIIGGTTSYSAGVTPWHMVPIVSDDTFAFDSNCRATITWNPATPWNHTDTLTISPCAAAKKTRIYLGFAMTFAVMYPLVTIVVAIMKHRMRVMHRVLTLLASLFITVLFCKLAIDAWQLTKGVLLASTGNRLQVWSTINEGGEGDSMLSLMCWVLGPCLFLINGICGIFPRRRRSSREAHVPVVL